jgi:hypothetical protein
MARPVRPLSATGRSSCTPPVTVCHCADGVFPTCAFNSRSDHFSAWVTGLNPARVTYTRM